MTVRFTKMHGLGNDFVLIDATQKQVELNAEIIQKMADRHTGIGFDQLLVIETAQEQEYDFFYRIFNADGQEVEQCGNGARCVAHYLSSERLTRKKKLILKTIAGAIELVANADGQIIVNMGSPQFIPESLPFLAEKQATQYELTIGGKYLKFGAISLGNPHVVMQVKNVLNTPVDELGKLFQNHPAFPKQVNVGFMEIVATDHIRLRVYERGVGETQACGSGACAAVVIGRLCHNLGQQVNVELLGGKLLVYWKSSSGAVYMTGPAKRVFRGELVIEE
jgi:diaminopimelate epimerase